MKRNIINDERMMLRVSDMYYNQNLSQQEIALQLSISRPTVSKLLTAARQHGIVTISVNDINGRKYYQLEHALEDAFALQEVFVVDTAATTAETKRAIGKATQEYLARIIEDNSIIGLSMGTTVAQIPLFQPPTFHKNLTFIPLVGGVGVVENELHSNSLAEAMARVYGGKYLPLHAPAMVSRKKTKIELMKESAIQKVFKMAGKMDIALLGIGAPDPTSTVVKTGYITTAMLKKIKEENICGDICMNFYDETGNTEIFEYNDKVIAIDLSTLRKVRHSIGLVEGSGKAEATLGAINGRYITTLITDLDCARALELLI